MHYLVLFDPYIELYQVLLLWSRVVASEWWQRMGNPYSVKLQNYWSLAIRLCCVISRTLVVRVLRLCREAVGVFYSPGRLGKETMKVTVMIKYFSMHKFIIYDIYFRIGHYIRSNLIHSSISDFFSFTPIRGSSIFNRCCLIDVAYLMLVECKMIFRLG